MADVQPALSLQVALMSAIGGWSAFLAQRSIAAFHDGLRPILPELMAGRMTRGRIGSLAMSMSVGFILGLGLPLTLTTGMIVAYVVLLPADIIGVRSTRWWIATLGGAAWGASLVATLAGFWAVAGALPIDIILPVRSMLPPAMFALAALPAMAVATQFGWRLGTLALGVSLLTRQAAVTFRSPDAQMWVEPTAAAIFAGTLFIVVAAFTRDQKRGAGHKKAHALGHEDEVAAGDNGSSCDDDGRRLGQSASNLGRLRKHAPLIAIGGALLAVASHYLVLAGSEVNVVPLANRELSVAASADITRALSFVPLVAGSAAAVGAYQVVGFTLVFPAGYLSPNWPIAAVAGAVIMMAELAAIRRILPLLDRFPSLREASEHLRGAAAKVLEVGLLVGGLIAGNELAPGGLGYFAVAGLFLMNEAAGRRLQPMAAAPVGVLILWLLLNLLRFMGWGMP